jgi:hypothetical protein
VGNDISDLHQSGQVAMHEEWSPPLENLESALRDFDELYAQATGASVLAEVADRLAAAVPGDAKRIDLSSYRGLQAPWNDWNYLVERGRSFAAIVARIALTGERGAP